MRFSSLLFILFCPLLLCAQKPQPLNPALFEGLPLVRDWTMTAYGTEAYFTVVSAKFDLGVILRTEKGEQGEWQEPEVATFSGVHRDLEPALSPDGLKLYFASNRTPDQQDTKSDTDIWYVERESPSSAWSAPVRLPEIINTEADEFYPSVAANGNLYFTASRPDAKGKEDIYLSRRNGEGYTEPESLPEAVNSTGYEFNAFIAPDEAFLLYTAYGREDDLGRGDLYISYRTDGEWQPARHMGKTINSSQLDYCPFYHAPSGTLYFTSQRSTLGNARASAFSLAELKQALKQPQNGQGSIYRHSFDPYKIFQKQKLGVK